MKISRLRALAVLITALALLVAACGPQATEEPTATPEPTAEEVVETEEAEETAEEETAEAEAAEETEEATEEAEATEAVEEEATEEAEATEEMEATEEAADEPGTIVEVASATEGFSTLVAAVEAAELVDTLNGEGPFTVFAPTDEAFEAALEALDLTADELLADTELLTSVLTYHVVSGEVTSDMLEAGEVETLNGATVDISLDEGVMVNDATVTTPDVQASNGVIHVIDAVLLPPADEEAEATEEMEATEEVEEPRGAAGEEATEEATEEAEMEATEEMADMEATEEATEEMTDMEATEEAEMEATEEMADMEATEEATEEMGDMGGEETAETATYEDTYSFDYPGNFEVNESLTVDLVTLTADAQRIVVAGPNSYNGIVGGRTFESDSEALAFYLDRAGYDVGEETSMDMGLASYNVELGRAGQVGAATLVDLNNDRRAVVIELADSEDNVPNAAGATIMESISYTDIVDVAAEAGTFETLIAAVQAAELEDALRNSELTVFAPTDEAFAAALESLGLTAEELLADTETLTRILQYHVVEGTVPSSAVVELDGEPVTTLLGEDVTVGVDGETVTLTDAMDNTVTVTAVDIEAANGVIHVIDGVLLPPEPEPEATPEATAEATMEATEEADMEATEEATEEIGDMEATEEASAEETAPEEVSDDPTLAELASSTEDLSTLANLAVRGGLFPNLTGDDELTIFAPTNEAFTAALESLGLTVEDLVEDRETLQTILQYHIVAGEVTSDMLEAGEVEMLSGEIVTISLEDGVMVNDATVVMADVQASNGVVHVIDAVLLPPSIAGDGEE